jgi:proteasome lid subunit RPN8/RPN11
MALVVTLSQLESLRDRAEQTYPEECCGLLLGRAKAEEKILVEVVPTENSWDADAAESFADISETGARAASKHRSFAIAPSVMLQVQQQARDRDLNIVGIFHSHPDSPAIPSEFDRAIAWSEYSYLIVSVLQGRAGEILSWMLDDRHQFQPEPIIISVEKF